MCGEISDGHAERSSEPAALNDQGDRLFGKQLP
jgi:hypothetical protein